MVGRVSEAENDGFRVLMADEDGGKVFFFFG